MAAKRPLTPLETVVLGLVTERPMHPYEMYQLLMARREDRLVKIKPGSLYHAVTRLDEAKLLVAQCVEREGKRPERTVYEITDAGRDLLLARLRELLVAPAEEYPAFLLAIAESHNLPREDALDLLGRRRAALARQLEEYESGLQGALGRGVDRRYLLDAFYSVAMRTAELRWLDQLIHDIDIDTMNWP